MVEGDEQFELYAVGGVTSRVTAPIGFGDCAVDRGIIRILPSLRDADSVSMPGMLPTD
jgi:hypothetical protein